MNRAQILALLNQKVAKQQAIVDSGTMTAEQQAEFKDLQAEIDGLKAQLAAMDQLEANNAYLDGPAKPPVHPVDMSVQDTKLDDGGFKNIGELAHCLKFGDSKGRIKNLATSDVGVLIPPAFSQTILQLNPEEEIIAPRANVIPAGTPPDAEFTIPYLQQGADGALGGVELTWTAEGKTVSDVNDPVLKDLTLKPFEVSGMATINNKTLTNWGACGAFIQSMLRQAFVSGRDMKFLRGSGVGCPLGIVNAPGKITITRDTSAVIKYEDIVTMLGRMLPEALNGAFFLASLTALPNLMQLSDSSGRLIMVNGDATKGIPATLAGLPLKFTGKLPTIGNEADLILVNPNPYYLVKEGSGPFLAISEHVKFTSNKTVFKIVANIDGQPWVKDPLKLEDGETTVSPYVILK